MKERSKSINHHLIRLIILSIILLITEKGMGQANTLTAGKDVTTSEGSLSYSVGQIDYLAATASTGTATQGVQQPYEIYILGSAGDYSMVLSAKVYPNPASEVVRLFIPNTPKEQLYCELNDLNARLINKFPINDQITEISLAGLANATYFLSVSNATRTVQTFKIIKH